MVDDCVRLCGNGLWSRYRWAPLPGRLCALAVAQWLQVLGAHPQGEAGHALAANDGDDHASDPPLAILLPTHQHTGPAAGDLGSVDHPAGARAAALRQLATAGGFIGGAGVAFARWLLEPGYPTCQRSVAP